MFKEHVAPQSIFLKPATIITEFSFTNHLYLFDLRNNHLKKQGQLQKACLHLSVLDPLTQLHTPQALTTAIDPT